MTESDNATAQAPGARQFGLRRLYVKDVSFEAPNSPGVFTESLGEPEIKLNLRTSTRNLEDGSVEVVLHVSAHAQSGQRTVFLVEVAQAGAFQISGFQPEETRAIVTVACPNTLFPYAREAVSSLVQKGGFPPLIMQPIDFSVLVADSGRAAGHA